MKGTLVLLALALLACDKVKDPVAPADTATVHQITAVLRDSASGQLVPNVKITATCDSMGGVWAFYAPDGTGTWTVRDGVWHVVISAPGYADLPATLHVASYSTYFEFMMARARP